MPAKRAKIMCQMGLIKLLFGDKIQECALTPKYYITSNTFAEGFAQRIIYLRIVKI